MTEIEREDKAKRIGTWILDRTAIIAVVIFLQFASIGLMAWGIAQSNRNFQEQNERDDRADTRQFEELKAGQELVKDCSSPGGKCFEEQIRASSVGALLGSIGLAPIIMLECIEPLEIRDRTPEVMAACRKKVEIAQAEAIQRAVDLNQKNGAPK